MDRNETKELLMILEATFPNFEVKDPRATVAAWQLMLDEYPYNNIKMALKIYVSSQGTAFAPSASQLIAMTRRSEELSQMDVVSAWGQVRKAIRNGIYGSEKEFERLAPEVQRAVGNPSQIREWAMLPSDTVDSVIHSEFRRRFDTMQKRDLEIRSLPQEVREQIEKKSRLLLTNENITDNI